MHRLTWSSYCNRYLCVPFGAKLKHSEVEPLPRQHSCTGQCLLCCTPLTWNLFTCASAWLSMYVKTLFRCGPFRDRYFNYFELNQLPLYKAPYIALISIQTMPKETSSRGKSPSASIARVLHSHKPLLHGAFGVLPEGRPGSLLKVRTPDKTINSKIKVRNPIDSPNCFE